MISQKEFIKLNKPRWTKAEGDLYSLEKKNELTAEEARQLPATFRKVCQDLGVARERLYGMKLTNALNQLVMDFFHHIHRSKNILNPIPYLTRTFPGAVKHNMPFLWISIALFWVPFLLLAFSGNWGMQWIQALLGPEGMYGIDQSYGKEGNALEHARDTYGSDFMMFCHYIANNVGIDFRCFAGGIFYGIGTLFFTVYNGLAIGAVFGYVHETGDPHKLYSFVSGHSAFEIMGLHLSSVAGFRLGWGLISPGNQSRMSSLIRNARHSLVILGGAAILTFLAACIEGFWSAHQHPLPLKYTIGVVLWIVTIIYVFSGKKEWYERP